MLMVRPADVSVVVLAGDTRERSVPAVDSSDTSHRLPDKKACLCSLFRHNNCSRCFHSSPGARWTWRLSPRRRSWRQRAPP
jgi:hypothetical protein